MLLYSARSPATRGIKLLRSLPRFLLLTAGLSSILFPLASSIRAAVADSPTEADEEEVIQRILDLRQQIEDLLEILPEEVRQEVEQRWRESQAKRSVPEPELESEPAQERESEPALEPVVEPDISGEEESAAERAPPCGGFHLFDTNEDSLVSGGDRQWRFLRLWFDHNGDGNLDESEIERLFDLGVRQIDVGLRFYGSDDSESEDVDVDGLIWLREVGKGNSGRRSGALVVAADRLVRDGHLWLVAPDGSQLSGYQPLVSVTILETRDGQRSPLLCQETE